MRSLIQKTRLLQLVEQRNGYLVLACGLIIMCMLLTLLSFYLSNRERIIVTPPVVSRTFWVSHSEVSPDYLSQMTLFFADLRFNVTPESSDTQRQILLRYVDPSDYGVLNDNLIAERDRIVAQHISSVFYPVDVQVDAKALTATITGDLVSSIGTTELSPERVSYLIKYHYDNGRLFVEQFQEVKRHED